MSDPQDPISPTPPPPPPPPPAQRAASVTLREQASQEPDAAALMDPANQSLADALKITFFLVKAAMIILAALFALSGFQSINEGERGIRLVFGKPVGEDLEPGFRFSFPYPIGELVKVKTGAESFQIVDKYWQYFDEQMKFRPHEQNATRGAARLTPGRDGSVITSDLNVAHTRWSVVYRRVDPTAVQRNVYDAHEQAIVEGAIQRAVVRAISQTSLDALLKQTEKGPGSVASVVAQHAQQMLDQMDAGIQIDSVQLTDKVPPFREYNSFTEVATAQSRANEAKEKASQNADTALTAAAGQGAAVLLQQIARYEEALELEDEARAERILESIDALLMGQAFEFEGEEFKAKLVSGEVTRIINAAEQYRASVSSTYRAKVATFQAKLAQFRSNPLVLVQTEWTDAMTAFLDNPTLQIMMVPPGAAEIELLLNPDPDILKELERVARLRRGEAAQEERERLRRESRYRLQQGLDRPVGQ